MGGSYRRISHSPFCERSQEQLLRECRQVWRPSLSPLDPDRNVTGPYNSAWQPYLYICFSRYVGSHDCSLCVFYHIVNFLWFVRVVMSKCPDPKMFKSIQNCIWPKRNSIRVVMLHARRCDLNQTTTKGITLQPHQILRLPRKMNLMIDRAHIWNVIYNARSDRNLPPTSPNTAPATQNESHDCSASHMKRHLQCAEQQASPSNRTKYCACHAKWMSWLIVLTYETSFPMRRAARVTLPLHQVLRLPRKMNLMFDPHHIWNVISNAWSNRHQSPTSPNTAPTTQNSTPKS